MRSSKVKVPEGHVRNELSPTSFETFFCSKLAFKVFDYLPPMVDYFQSTLENNNLTSLKNLNLASHSINKNVTLYLWDTLNVVIDETNFRDVRAKHIKAKLWSITNFR
jgi:hypothetical protein